MTGFRQHPFRVIGRFIWFGGEILIAVFDFLVHCAFCPADSAPAARALWLHRAARRTGRIIRLKVQSSGPIPASGLLICNHLSYVDIIVLVSLSPAMFVAKSDIKSWPVIGWLTRLAGTIFIDRERRLHVGQINDEIENALSRGALVIIFPEGTSSDGQTVLPFKSSLLEPATRPGRPVSVGLIQYDSGGDDDGGAICYWGEDTFFPHLLNLFGRRNVRARVRFAPVESSGADRKELAQQLHARLLKLKDAAVDWKQP